MNKTEINVTVKGGDTELTAVMTVTDKTKSIDDFDAFSEELNDALSETFRKVSFKHLELPNEQKYTNNKKKEVKEKEKALSEVAIEKSSILESVKKTEDELTEKQKKLLDKAVKDMNTKKDAGMPMPLIIILSDAFDDFLYSIVG